MRRNILARAVRSVFADSPIFISTPTSRYRIGTDKSERGMLCEALEQRMLLANPTNFWWFDEQGNGFWCGPWGVSSKLSTTPPVYCDCGGSDPGPASPYRPKRGGSPLMEANFES